MKTIKSNLKSEAVYDDKQTRRYALNLEWQKDLKRACVIMLCAGTSNGIAFDRTTCLTLENLARLGFGSVNIVNLFAEINDGRSKISKNDDKQNITYIANAAKDSDTIIYAAGTGKTNNSNFCRRLEQAMDKLRQYEENLMCITDGYGGKFYHPLFPKVREWHLEHFKIDELVGIATTTKTKAGQEAKHDAVQSKNKTRPKEDSGFVSIGDIH